MSTDIATAGGSLAIRPEQTAWTTEQAAVLRQSGIDNEVAPAELSAFLHLCQRTQLDPFSRQIYLIGRYDRRAGRKVYTPQTSIDGYRVIAHRAAAKAGQSIGYEDTLWCDKSGRWYDVWLADEPPAAAKVTVVRNGQRFPAVAKYREYVQTNKDGKPIGLWGRMDATMIAKCAESLAHRMAFPHDLAGVYTAEEMGQADNGQQERHLRQVPAGEPDQWASAAPERNWVADALAADVAAAVRTVWQEAKRAGQPDVVLEQIAEIGREKAGAEQPAPSDDGVVDVETVEDEPVDDHAEAVAELRAFAAEHGVTDIDADAYTALGAPLDDVGADAIRGLLAQLRKAA